MQPRHFKKLSKGFNGGGSSTESEVKPWSFSCAKACKLWLFPYVLEMFARNMMMWDRCDWRSPISPSGFQSGKSGGFGQVPDPP